MTDSGDDPSFDIGAEDGSEDALSSVNGPSDAFGGSFYAGDAYLGTDAGFPIVIDGAVLQSPGDLLGFGHHDYASPPDQTEDHGDVLQVPNLVADDGAALLAPPPAPSLPVDAEPAMPPRFGESLSDAGHHDSNEPAEDTEDDPAASWP